MTRVLWLVEQIFKLWLFDDDKCHGKEKNMKGLIFNGGQMRWLIGLLCILQLWQPLGGLLAGDKEANLPEIWAIVRNSDPAEMAPSVVMAPVVHGVVYYTALLAIEPEEGRYDWSGIDRAIELCRASGKPLKIAILGGRWVPDWIYAKGAERFTWEHETPYVEAGRQRVSSAIPWDPVYLGAMEKALQACAERYRNEPLLEEVQVTGPALANGLELNMSVTAEEGKQMGYSREKLAGAWKRMLDVCAEAFPRQSLSLALHNDLFGERTDSLAKEVRDYGLKAYGGRLNLLVCYATYEPWFQRGNNAVDMWAEVPLPTKKEAQLIDLFSVKKTPKEKVKEAIRKSVALGASKIEVFAGDVYDDAYRVSLDEVMAEMCEARQVKGSNNQK